jgi:hypothetical protein
MKGALETLSVVASRGAHGLGRKERLVELALAPDAVAQLRASWVPVLHAYELAPGRYQARLAVRDRGRGTVGSVRHEFTVPALGGLRITDPVLSDALLPSAEGAAPMPAPIARRSFATGRRLHCRFEVEGAAKDPGLGAPRVLVTYEVVRAGGQVVTRTEPTPLPADEAGTLARTFSLALNKTGRYEIRLKAEDRVSGATATASVPFEVE